MSVWRFLGTYKDQLTVVFVFVAATFTVFQYLGQQRDLRVARSLQYVERQNEAWLEARAYIAQKWMDSEHRKLRSKFQVYSDALKERALNIALKDNTYRDSLHQLHPFYVEVALCSLRRLCDVFTTCKAFFAEIQEFRNLNQLYFKKWSDAIKENKTYYLDRMLQQCDSPDIIFGIQDESWMCQGWLYFKSLFKLGNARVCGPPTEPKSGTSDLLTLSEKTRTLLDGSRSECT